MLRWMEFSMLSKPARDQINSERLLPVEETRDLLIKVFDGTLIIKETDELDIDLQD